MSTSDHTGDPTWEDDVISRIMRHDGVDESEAIRRYNDRKAALLMEQHEHVIDHGWALQGVFGIDGPNGGKTAFVYTIGNDEVGLPELLMTGADPDTFGGILNDATEQMRAGAFGAFDHGSEIVLYPDHADPCPLRVVRLDPYRTVTEDWFNMWFAMRGHLREALWAYQLVWAGRGIDDDQDGPLMWPTLEDEWRDQPIFGEVWW